MFQGEEKRAQRRRLEEQDSAPATQTINQNPVPMLSPISIDQVQHS